MPPRPAAAVARRLFTPLAMNRRRCVEEVRSGGVSATAGVDTSTYVAPDAHGGHGLFAATALPRHHIIGEYTGTLARGFLAPDTTACSAACGTERPAAARALEVLANLRRDSAAW